MTIINASIDPAQLIGLFRTVEEFLGPLAIPLNFFTGLSKESTATDLGKILYNQCRPSNPLFIHDFNDRLRNIYPDAALGQLSDLAAQGNSAAEMYFHQLSSQFLAGSLLFACSYVEEAINAIAQSGRTDVRQVMKIGAYVRDEIGLKGLASRIALDCFDKSRDKREGVLDIDDRAYEDLFEFGFDQEARAIFREDDRRSWLRENITSPVAKCVGERIKLIVSLYKYGTGDEEEIVSCLDDLIRQVDQLHPRAYAGEENPVIILVRELLFAMVPLRQEKYNRPRQILKDRMLDLVQNYFERPDRNVRVVKDIGEILESIITISFNKKFFSKTEQGRIEAFISVSLD